MTKTRVGTGAGSDPQQRPQNAPQEAPQGDPRDEHGLRNRVVVLTGATRGIGRGLARHLGTHGAKLALTGRNPDRLAATSAELTALGVDHLTMACDVADRDAAVELARRTADRFGRIDGLVANAQTFRPVTPLEAVTESDMDLLFGTGPKGTLWSMQAVFPYMRDAGHGRIVTMGSAVGMTGGAGYGPYSASKEAVRSLTRTAAREWARHGITVNCVCPASAAHRRPPADDPERRAVFDAMYAQHPMGRDGDPERDIAPPVVFLLSDASRYITGETFMVDGGGQMRA
ncbi:SDR family NAD(P)-dependent oxidoreductase [Yinghuangia seranimata]|uniref:SDR family NAD(P)-dependent oxidoreductase n=1 Tax=Yinghuangia seranimata TaxID=408067 RepID=UPI00248AE6A8|nr:SDR family NAD(P)-dependent oxidoreductase [Yinghuangia seranimata]MDI2129664.1 SDR family NAD(P)-dependent oxidoreductase [Yinghuangia seranimata]